MHATLYDSIGQSYNSTRKADPRITQRIYSLLSPVNKGCYLDLACGTGNYTVTLSNLGLTICGVDSSELMIRNARRKTAAIAWKVGHAETLSFPAVSSDGVVCTLATHHFVSIRHAFSEVFRVIKSGRFVIFTAYPEQMTSYWLNEYFPATLKDARSKMPSRSALAAALADAGFQYIEEERFEIPPDLADLFLYSGNHRPEIYLLPEVRAGISSFANEECEEEVFEGCRRLEHDSRFRSNR